MASAFKNLCARFIEIETALINNLLERFLPGNFYPALVTIPGITVSEEKSSLKNILQDSFLLAVPKHRRSVEKNRCRKFGHPKYHYKLLTPKKDILTCYNCGGHFEQGTLCGQCYNKVKKETEEIQEEIKKKLGISPIENEVVVLYEGERYESTFGKGNIIVEMKKPRPSFFSKNLLQRSAEVSSAESGHLEVEQQAAKKY